MNVTSSIAFASLIGVAAALGAIVVRADTPQSMGDRKNQLQLRYGGIFVEDVPATVAFYQKAFGLSLRYMHPSKCYAELATGTVLLAFIGEAFIEATHLLGDTRWHRNRMGREPSGSQIAFVSANLADDWRRAVAAGAVDLKAPEAKPWGQTVGYLRDLNGFIVELCTPPTRQGDPTRK